METYTITKNADFGSLEITFNGKPAQAVRDALKSLKFRWHAAKMVWYGYTTEEAVRAAIDGAGSGESEQEQQGERATARRAAPAANKPDQEHIRIYYNGIKIDGGDLIRCMYSIDNNVNHSESVTVYACDYKDLPRDLLPVENGSDSYTDYFEKDRATLTPEHPLYKYFRFAGLKARARDAKRYCDRLQKDLDAGKGYEWTGRRDFWKNEIKSHQKHIDEFNAATDPGQPTAADLDAINRQRQQQENAEREEKHREELEERERVLRAKNEGRRMIEAQAEQYPIEAGAPVVTINWSENPAFYTWEENELQLSIKAAEHVLSVLDIAVFAQGRGCDKTAFTVEWEDENGEKMTYKGRYDLGDNDGGLIAHIRSLGEWERTHEEYGKEKETPDATNDRLQVADFLEKFIA